MNTLNYYSLGNCTNIFNAVDSPNFRVWKIIDCDERCYQNKFKITNPIKLYNFIHQAKNPIALYYSISTFLKPESNHGFFWNQRIDDKALKQYFYPRAGYLAADCILLSSYFFIDLDAEGHLEIAQEDGRKIINKLKDVPGLTLAFIRYSGKKGIHIGYNHDYITTEHPFHRIELVQAQKSAIMKELVKLNLKTINDMHIEISKNVFCVMAAPYSIKQNNNIVTPISEEDFMSKDISSILSLSRDALKNAYDKNVAVAEEKSLATQTYQDGERAGLSSHSIYFKFVDNMVRGLKNNYITVLKCRNDRFRIETIRKIQKKYNLDDFLIDKIGDYTYAYNTKLVQFKRLVKILRAAKSINLNQFITRKHLPIQVSDSEDSDGNIMERQVYLETVKTDKSNDMHSKGHNMLFGFSHDNVTGESLRIGTMKIEVQA